MSVDMSALNGVTTHLTEDGLYSTTWYNACEIDLIFRKLIDERDYYKKQVEDAIYPDAPDYTKEFDPNGTAHYLVEIGPEKLIAIPNPETFRSMFNSTIKDIASGKYADKKE